MVSETTSAPDEIRAVEQLNERYSQLREQLGGVIVGLDDVIEQTLIAILCRGHCILQGMPGLAKTMASILFNVSPYDPLVFLAVPAVIALFALPAILSPAVRATRVDPSALFRVG